MWLAILLSSCPTFSHFPHFPQADCALSGSDSQVGRLVYVLGPCGSPMNSPVRLGFSPSASTPTGVFSQRFEALFRRAGALGCAVCLTPQLFLPVYMHTNVALGPPAATLPIPVTSSLPWLLDTALLPV